MKSIIIALTVGGVTENAILKTNADSAKTQNLTIMQVERPAGVAVTAFPFRAGTQCNISEILETLALSAAQGLLTITSVKFEDMGSSVSLTLPVIKKVQVSVTNEGATLKIDGVVQPGLSWVGYLHKGESVTYTAELEGYTTQTDTLTVNTSDITEEITLVEA